MKYPYVDFEGVLKPNDRIFLHLDHALKKKNQESMLIKIYDDSTSDALSYNDYWD